jgi:outer membrane murein-binding lipoprotein Lpp
MAERKSQKDLLSRLSDVGEEALTRVAGSPTTSRVLDTVGGMRERVDEIQKKVRGLDALEKRVAKLEKQVEELSKPKRAASATRSRATATKRPAARSTPPKKPTS